MTANRYCLGPSAVATVSVSTLMKSQVSHTQGQQQ
jgi:hypothetical protein